MKGIIFKPDMFQAIIQGRKTQTRRTGGLNHVNENPDRNKFFGMRKDPKVYHFNKTKRINEIKRLKGICAEFYIIYSVYDSQFFRPRYQPGDIVYLKEPYINSNADGLIYRYQSSLEGAEYNHFPWQNKLFMPAKYARHFIEIESVGLERVQDISLRDALNEGVYRFAPKEAFQKKWIVINGKESWNHNPWVWVYQFKYLDGVHNLAEAKELATQSTQST